MQFIYNTPSTSWLSGLPEGNGHAGVMVRSGIVSDRLDLTEQTFFSGSESRDADNRTGAAASFLIMRSAALKDDYEKVKDTAQHFKGVRNNYGTALPAFSILVEYDFHNETDKCMCSISRTLDITNGIASSIVQSGDEERQSETFVSHPDNCIIYNVFCAKPFSCAMRVLPFSVPQTVITSCGSSLHISADARETVHSDGTCGVHLDSVVRCVTDGTVECVMVPACSSDDAENVPHKAVQHAADSYIPSFRITGATHITLYIVLASGLLSSGIPDEIQYASLESHVNTAVQMGFTVLKKRHTEDVSRIMKRVQLEIKDKRGNSIDDIPKMMQYGRYLLLCSSREDSVLPAHLQGIWNDGVACRIGWTCDMHLDINTQMNYFPSEVLNLKETLPPLFHYITGTLVPSGRITAAKTYGMKGWAAELVSNAWGYTAPYWAVELAPCPTGGAWLMYALWEHYCFTHDTGFLAETAFPVISEAAQFFEQYVFTDNKGQVTSGPSISPENSFIYNRRNYQISLGCTYEIAVIREVFSIYLVSASVLGREKKEEEKCKHIRELLQKLVPYRILSDGTIAEWSHIYPAADPQHRHTSHLLGLYPFSQITREKTPELARAAELTVQAKLTPEENWEDTGWARSMLLLYSARLGNGEEALHHIQHMMKKLCAPNRFIIHPPTRGAPAFDTVYELDGNTGLSAGIAEMLVQSHEGVIRLLPALPVLWKDGQFSGFRLRGGITVALVWKSLYPVRAELKADIETDCIVVWNTCRKTEHIAAGQTIQITDFSQYAN